jgi:predicted RNA-binding Zn-ribbon protein involved in translation (DUF1610 family)
MKILLLDVETSPNTVYTWGLFNQFVALNQIIETSKLLSWSAKWLGDKDTMFDSINNNPPYLVLKNINKLLNKADIVITYNGNHFDIPVLNRELLLLGFSAPSPYKSLDLYQTVKRQFRFASNKLDHVCEQLGLGHKNHTDFKLWVDCMKGDAEAWIDMEAYNRHDVELLERLYNRILPYIKNHPNLNLFTNGTHVCPNCGGVHLQKRGSSYTISGSYQRYRCKECGTWSRNSKKNKESVAIQGAT